MSTIGFWINVAMLILPLIALLFLIDNSKAFHIGFYGFNIHVWFTYIDAIGIRYALWNHPYQAIPFMPASFGLDAALVPVIYMLTYQWTVNNNKNYYIYLITLSALFAFVFKPFIALFDLFTLNKGFNYFHLFLLYVGMVILSKVITSIFEKFETRDAKKDKGL